MSCVLAMQPTPRPTTEPGSPTHQPTPRPTPNPTQHPTLRPTLSPDATPAPALPYEYAPTADATPYCRLRDAEVCWGNTHRFSEVVANAPFEGIDGGAYASPAFGDLDGDGDLDLVLGVESGGKLLYYENVEGRFERRTQGANPFDGIDAGSKSAPALADLDADGDLDVVIGSYDGTVAFLENTGSREAPTFEKNDNLLAAVTGKGYTHPKPTLADVDNDGAVDLIVGQLQCHLDDRLAFFQNTGNATVPRFEERTDEADPFSSIGVGRDSSVPTLADVEGDGDLDLVVVLREGQVWEMRYFENVGFTGQPVFMARTESDNPFDGVSETYGSPVLVDLDDDGDVDLVLGRQDGALGLYVNRGTSTAPELIARADAISPFESVEGAGGNGAPAFADVDGDGDEDVIMGSADGGLVLYENVGDAGKPLFERTDLLDGVAVGDADSTPSLVDIQGDGAIDLVVGSSGGKLVYYRNVGSTGFEKVEGAADDPFAGIDVGENSAPHFADLDDDGDVDLVIGAEDGKLYYYQNVGSSTEPVFVNTTANPFANVSVGYYSSPALADLDGDGDLDLFLGERGGTLMQYKNVGSALAPRFVAESEAWLEVGDDTDGIARKPAFVDLDGDGDLDLVVGNGAAVTYYANGHCISSPTSCNGRGICDDNVLLLPSCNCLTGIAGEQCERCQTGYFGATCDLCPEGGNETNNMPRITDTCGVAGSGRSRGTCDDGVAGTGKCTCFAGFSGESCTKGVCPAGTIENARKSGVFYEAFCEPCARGEYQVDDQCVKCPSPSTTMAAGATGCYTCSAGSFFSPFPIYDGRDGKDPVRCDDAAALEAQCQDKDDTACFDKCCLPCERGMDCDNPANNTLRRVVIDDGWWRESEFSKDIYKCESAVSCKGGLCTEGHKGVTCRVCASGFYYSAIGSRCLECGSFRAHPIAIVSGICLLLLIVAALYVFKQRRPELFAKTFGAAEEKLRSMAIDAGRKDIDVLGEGNEVAKRLAEANALSVATDGLDGVAAVGRGANSVLSKAPTEINEMVVGAATGAATDILTKKDEEEDEGSSTKEVDEEEDAEKAAEEEEEERRKTFWESVQTKLKILIAVYQIQNALPWTLPFVSYPDAFEALVNWLSFIELDLVRIIPMECAMPHNFFDKLFASTMIPLVLAGIILVFGKLASLARRDPAERRAAWIYAYSWFLLLTYVVFTGVSTTVLRFFNCVEYQSRDGDGASVKFKVMQADHSISCESPTYEKWKGYAWIMVFIYPIGIPSWYLLELLWWRKGINPDVDERRHNLTSKYRLGMAPETPQEQAYFKFREKESESMRDLRHKAFEHVEMVALSLDEIQERKMELRADDHDIQHLAFLFGEFEPRCYLFVVFECLRRLALTGLLIFVYNGSATQVVVGLFIAIISSHVMSEYNPYIEDSDDRLAKLGQLQILLLFVASLVLFVKTMPEQDGAPGNLFKGPLFAALMVIIGTMTLTVTFYTLAVENLNIKSAKDVQDKAKELQAKAKAAAKTAKDKLTGRGKKKAFFGGDEDGGDDEDDDDDDAAAQVVVTPHGDEGPSLLDQKEGWLAPPAREWGRTADGKMGWLPRPAPASAPLVREMPLQQEARVDVEAPAVHKKHHHHHKKTSPADADVEAPPPPPSDDEEAPPPPPDEDDDEEAPPPPDEDEEEALPPPPGDDDDDAPPPPEADNKTKGNWLLSIIGAKKVVAARQTRSVEAASDGGVPEAKAEEPAAEEEPEARRKKAPPKKAPAKQAVPKKQPPKKAPPAKKPDARKPPTPAAKKRSWFPKGRAAQKPAARPAPAPAAPTTPPGQAPAPAAQAARAEIGRGTAPPAPAPAPATTAAAPAPGPASGVAEAKTERGVAEAKAESAERASEAQPKQAPPAKPEAKPAAKPTTAPAPVPAAKKRGWFPMRTAKPKQVAQSAPAPAAKPTTRAAIGQGAAPPATAAPAGAPDVKGEPVLAPAPAAQATTRAEIGRGTAPPADAPAAAPATTTAVAEAKAEPGVAEAKTEQADRTSEAPPKKAPPKKAPPKKAPPSRPAAKPATAPSPAPAAKKKRSWFPTSRAAQHKPVAQPAPAPTPAKNVVKGQPAPAPAPAPPTTTRPAIGRGAAPPAEEEKAADQVADIQYKSEGSSSEDEDHASTLERPTAPPTARPTATRAASWVGGESTTLLPAASARPTAMRAASWVGGPLVSPPSLRTPNPAAAAPPLVPRAPPAASVFTVVGRSGGRMRASVEMTSPLVGDLPRGSLVVVHERGVTSTGAARCRVVAGEAQGWLSEKVLAPADGVAAEKKTRVIDAALRLLATSAAAIDWAPAETDTGDGPATTPAGSRSRASTAAHSALRAVTTSAAFRAPATFQDGPASTPPGAPGLFRPALQPPLHCRVCLQRLPCECPTPVPAASTSSLEDGPP